MARKKAQARPLPKKPDRDHLDQLLDDALKGTFPASDPVAISMVEDDDARRVADKRKT
jgi:hypothetical protein